MTNAPASNINANGTYNVAVNKGAMNGAVSSQFSSRPEAERFTSLKEMHKFLTGLRDRSTEEDFQLQDLQVQDQDDELFFITPDGTKIEPTNWGFKQICSEVGAPADYLMRQPAYLAAINLQNDFAANAKDRTAYLLDSKSGTAKLRSITSQKYGRIFDNDVVAQMMEASTKGRAEWKVPGMIDWASGNYQTGTYAYDPNVPVTKATTTLFASDRDLFMFLCDDRNPIEIGKLPNGEPDLVFRGIIAANSEVKSRKLVLAGMYLRGVCCNRNLWGVEGFTEISIRHTFNAPDRFLDEVMPALDGYSKGNTKLLLAGVAAAKKAIVAKTDEERLEFLQEKVGLGRKKSQKVIDLVMVEEQHPATSVWDFAQGLTAAARAEDFQDERFNLEMKAGALLDKVAA